MRKNVFPFLYKVCKRGKQETLNSFLLFFGILHKKRARKKLQNRQKRNRMSIFKNYIKMFKVTDKPPDVNPVQIYLLVLKKHLPMQKISLSDFSLSILTKQMQVLRPLVIQQFNDFYVRTGSVLNSLLIKIFVECMCSPKRNAFDFA